MEQQMFAGKASDELKAATELHLGAGLGYYKGFRVL